MDDDVVSVDSPLALQGSSARPSTPQVSNPGTPRNEEPMLMSFSGASMSIMSAPSTNLATAQAAAASRQPPQSKYAQLLAVIEDLGKDIRPTYAGSKSSAERLKRGIVHARILMKPCLQWNTVYCADSVEFCPIQGREHLLACGTYQLIEDHQGKGTRIGRLHLLGLEIDESSDLQLAAIQEINMPGILDIKWCQHSLREQPVLALADASGAVRLYNLRRDSDVLVAVNEAVIEEANVLALSLDWSSAKQYSDHPLLSMSDSAGGVWVSEVNKTGLRQVAKWKAHEFEAWIVAFDYSDSNLLYSGGDDAKLKGWDMRQPPAKPTFTSSMHKMGVTSIHSNSERSCVLATGSYDEHVFVWDTRQMAKPTKCVDVGGGVWRLKWVPDSGGYLLAACMHGGAKVLGCESDDIYIKAAYLKHDSMVYGIDWCRRLSLSPINITLATCSFYEKALHVWQFKS